MRTPKVPVAKEGYPFIYFTSFVTLIISIIACQWIAYIGLILTAFVIAFFRDPERFTPKDANCVVSPADGKILFTELVSDDSYLNGKAQRICIFMNVFNVHVNRNPFSGKVCDIIYTPGRFYSADTDKSATHNERCATILETDTGKRIAFVQIAGLIARRIVTWLEVGDEVKKGERMGLIRFGSRVDVYLPPESIIDVKKGQKVRAGETIIARLIQ